MFRTQVSGQNVFHKFIELSMETPYLCPGEEHMAAGNQ